MAIHFDTIEFEFSHGRMPRGRGSWAFVFGKSRRDYTMEDVVFSPSMTYGDAKRWARAEAIRRKVEDVVVCP